MKRRKGRATTKSARRELSASARPSRKLRGGAVGRAEEHIKQGREEPDEQEVRAAVHEPGEHIPP